MTKQALGRGFEGLIPTGLDVNEVATPGEHVKQIDIKSIEANPEQPRKYFDEDSISELAESIKEHGIIQPLVVTPYKDNFKIVAGERRFRASRVAGLKKVPAIVRNHEELEELEIALVENVQRVDLSPLEQAVSIIKLRDQFSLTPKQISKKLGKAETTISNIIRLVNLPKEAVLAMQKNQISEGHARAILALKTDEKAQKDLLNKIITQKLSVREAEAYVKQSKIQNGMNKNVQNEDVDRILNSIKPDIRKTIKIKSKSKKSGSVIIDYNNIEELDSIIKKIGK